MLLACFLPRSSGRRSLIESRFGLRAPKGRRKGAGAERAQPQSGPASPARATRRSPIILIPGSGESERVLPSQSCSFENS